VTAITPLAASAACISGPNRMSSRWAARRALGLGWGPAQVESHHTASVPYTVARVAGHAHPPVTRASIYFLRPIVRPAAVASGR